MLAGCINRNGYRLVKIAGKNYLASHIIWALTTGRFPRQEIDHRNRNAINDKHDNLREATHSQNMQNRRRHANNTSGYRGVARYNGKHRPKLPPRWIAYININGKRKSLGYFKTPEDAAAAYEQAARQLFGEFHNSNDERSNG
jgi:hypothetical protein